jgi:putative nucleotidyltransferase with HDIG domain
MSWMQKGLKSKVGRRLLVIFCLSSLVPLFAFALISFLEVNRQLEEQTSERLHRTTKSIAHTFVGQLLLLTEDLKSIAADVRDVNTLGSVPAIGLARQHFLSLAIVRDGRVLTPLFGESPRAELLPPDYPVHLSTGRSLLICTPGPTPEIILAIALDPDQPHRGVILARPDPSFIFGISNAQIDSPGTSVFLLDAEDRLLFASPRVSERAFAKLVAALPQAPSGEFRWSSNDKDYLAYSWSVPLAFEFGTSAWTVVRSESASWVFAPLDSFRRNFLLLTAITVLLAVCASSIQIRRNLNPLAELREGTRRVASGDFLTTVEVSSGDEFEELARSFNAMSGEIQELHVSTLTALARSVDAKSPWTAGHSERVCRLALALARCLGLSESELVILQRGALLHDIGKIGVPSHILDKPGRLTDSEMEEVRRHPAVGARILDPIKAFSAAIPLVRNHHERLDGRGYPDGLKGDGIRFDVRILTVADAFDAMVSDRPYRQGMTFADAGQILRREMGTQFDPVPAQALLELLEKPGFAADLRSGDGFHQANPCRPVRLPDVPRSSRMWEVQ